MMTTGNGVDNDKTKIPDEFILRRVSLVCFIAELDELIDSQLVYLC